MNNFKNHKILAIEDNETFLEILLISLEENGFQVLGAENGQLGLQLAKEQMPDLIISDIQMPVLDGYDVLRILRQDPKTKKIPLIFITVEQSDRSRRRAWELGANDYLDKFCTIPEIIQAINTQLEIKKRNNFPKDIGKRIDTKIEANKLKSEICLLRNVRFIDWRDDLQQKGQKG